MISVAIIGLVGLTEVKEYDSTGKNNRTRSIIEDLIREIRGKSTAKPRSRLIRKFSRET